MATYGQRFCETVSEYLRTNDLINGKGQISLGRINSAALAALADKFEAERRKDKKERTARLGKGERDLLFEALASGTGSNPKMMTETELKRCAVAVSAIIRATPDVTPEEIEGACKRYPLLFNGATITTTAISNNWSKLCDPGRVGGVRKKRDPDDWWKQPAFDWHRVIALLWPRESNPDRSPWEEGPWDLVPSQIKKRIHSEGPAVLERNP